MPITHPYLAAVPLLLPLLFLLALPVLGGLRCPSVPAVILVGVRVVLRSIGWSIFSSLHIGQVFITWTIKNYINLLRQWQELSKRQLMGLHVQMCLHYLFLNSCRKNFHKVDSMEYKIFSNSYWNTQIHVLHLIIFVFISTEKGLIHIMIFVHVYLKDYYFPRKYISYFSNLFFLKKILN